MNKTLTVENVFFEEDGPIQASGAWQLSTAMTAPLGWVIPTKGILRDAGMAIALAISPVSCGSDPWFLDRKRRVPTTVEALFRPVLGRPITIQEARKIALEILARAEQERLEFAEAEARRGIDWEQQQ